MKERETPSNRQAESPFATPQAPRLSILHLMLWTLCSAVVLSLTRAIYTLQGDLPGGYAVLQNATGVIQGIFAGAVFAGAIVLVSTRVRCGPPMLRQPGHWLLIVSAIFHVTYVPLVIALLLLQKSGSDATWFLAVLGSIYAIQTIAFGFAALITRVLRWRLIFVGLAVVGLAQCLLYVGIGLNAFWPQFAMLSTFTSFGSLIVTGAILAVAIVDVVAGARNDWLHWMGVTTHVAGSSVTLLWMIGQKFVG